uniref:Uncharacterized protein n=1 Tax=Oryzias latipes TaxID=8090 RepID=A0A3B3HK86_ORYLA
SQRSDLHSNTLFIPPQIFRNLPLPLFHHPHRRMNILKDLKTDFAFLQETHMSSSSVNILATADFPNVYSAGYNSRQRGVAILINKEVKFTEANKVIDPEGRFIIVTLSTQNMQLCLANVYAPNVDDPKFFHSFFSALSEHTDNMRKKTSTAPPPANPPVREPLI